jgi:uncharacterized protein (UPF0332 family)
MPFDWPDYLELAHNMRKDASMPLSLEEASCRCAISRAYYAAYCTSSEFLAIKEGWRPIRNGPGSHDQVIERFEAQAARSNGDDKRMRMAIAKYLRLMKECRHRADYDKPFPPKPMTLRSSVGDTLKHSGLVIQFMGKITPNR